ncbi:MAG: BON domain-containing protein [Gammaproteobacteria bacterium]|nr:BON domain-containing protein [Gammaproteobacteria bacterium]NNF60646.1 BON domain-containing protein [Gammaproteobacteria bacterium]NNM20710.1 BON domain-containing protein [Gammaproteobacteria bacterium]
MTATIKTVTVIAAGLLFAPVAMAGEQLTSQVSAVLEAHPAQLEADVRGDTIVIDGKVSDYSVADQVVIEMAKLPGVNTIINNVRIS